MNKLFVLIIVAILLAGCESLRPLPEPIKKTTYLGWDDSLSKVICYTNGITLKYDNSQDRLEIGIQNKLTKEMDYSSSSLAELVNVDQLKIDDTMQYFLIYRMNNNQFKYTMTYGISQNNQMIHNAPRMKETGYKPVLGELIITTLAEKTGSGKIIKSGEQDRLIVNTMMSKNESLCWGINHADRQMHALKQGQNP